MTSIKNKGLLLAGFAVVAVVYNIFVFTIFSAEGKIFWASYAFTMMGLLLSGAVTAVCIQRALSLRDLFLSWPLLNTAVMYAAVQLAASFVFMSMPSAAATIAVLTQTGLLAAFLILSISAMFGGNVIDEVDKKQKEQTFFIQMTASDLEGLSARAVDRETKDKLQTLAESARYSDPISHTTLSGIEAEISERVRALSKQAAEGGNVTALCSEITLLLDERNAKCRFLK
jgi:hypothetical protein